MTYTPKTGSVYQLHFSDTSFWYMYHGNQGPDLSGRRFWCQLEHCSIPSQKMACMWLKWWCMIGCG